MRIMPTPENVGGIPAGEKQVKSWQEREISHACGSVCRIPQRSLRQITEIFPLLPIYPSSMPCSPSRSSSSHPSCAILFCLLARLFRRSILCLVRSVSLTLCIAADCCNGALTACKWRGISCALRYSQL